MTPGRRRPLYAGGALGVCCVTACASAGIACATAVAAAASAGNAFIIWRRFMTISPVLLLPGHLAFTKRGGPLAGPLPGLKPVSSDRLQSVACELEIALGGALRPGAAERAVVRAEVGELAVDHVADGGRVAFGGTLGFDVNGPR